LGYDFETDSRESGIDFNSHTRVYSYTPLRERNEKDADF
jgi:hypothetical protein